MATHLYIGTAGWNVPGIHARHFAAEGSHLVRYSRRLNCAEINSCFYREHKPETYRRWAESVPQGFRFAVKLPRAITHEGELRLSCRPVLERFLEQTGALGEKRGPVLLQLPPRFAFDAAVRLFFRMFRRLYDGPAVLEPRHPSWFAAEPDSMLREFSVARAAADPALAEEAMRPSGWPGLVYFRLHGSPRRYYSSYSEEFLLLLAENLRQPAASVNAWCIFDNTASGAALANALALNAHIQHQCVSR